MHIYPKNTGALTPNTTTASQSIKAVDAPTVQSVPATHSTTDRSDKVQISDAGRALAARGQNDEKASGLDPARVDQIRSRILSGAYDTLDVVDTVARRLIDSGDL